MESSSLQPEVWKDIPGCPGYQASTHGRIRSLQRSGEPKKIMAVNRNTVHLSFGKVRYSAHPARLVIWAFKGPVPEDMLFWKICYVNGDCTDWQPENLYMEEPTKLDPRPDPRQPYDKFHPSTHPRRG